MSRFEMKLPDVGEGVAEAEIVSWMVAVGDEVTPDSVLAEVLTDKATVEVSSPVTGTVAELHGEPGDLLAVGGDLIGIEVADGAPAPDPEEPGDDGVAADAGETPGEAAGGSSSESAADPGTDAGADAESTPDGSPTAGPGSPSDTATTDDVASDDQDHEPAAADRAATPVLAAPAVRRRAGDLGIDLADVDGTGPDGRIVHSDLDRLLAGGVGGAGRSVAWPGAASGSTEEVPIRGLRRRIAERLTAAWSEIPHITYVDAVDVTELEALRAELNRSADHERLTVLPFLVRAIAVACRDQPELNAHYDHGAETLTVVGAVHAGIATQTDSGLMVPVVRDAGTRRLRDLAAEIGRVTGAARDGSASRAELSGSTITITSLGALGGLVTTPIINPPEVAIVGVNKIETRPVWIDGAFRPRAMMNLSSSFDHRMVDGWDAATFVRRIKTLLENPALLFLDG